MVALRSFFILSFVFLRLVHLSLNRRSDHIIGARAFESIALTTSVDTQGHFARDPLSQADDNLTSEGPQVHINETRTQPESTPPDDILKSMLMNAGVLAIAELCGLDASKRVPAFFALQSRRDLTELAKETVVPKVSVGPQHEEELGRLLNEGMNLYFEGFDFLGVTQHWPGWQIVRLKSALQKSDRYWNEGNYHLLAGQGIILAMMALGRLPVLRILSPQERNSTADVVAAGLSIAQDPSLSGALSEVQRLALPIFLRHANRPALYMVRALVNFALEFIRSNPTLSKKFEAVQHLLQFLSPEQTMNMFFSSIVPYLKRLLQVDCVCGAATHPLFRMGYLG